MKNIVWKMGNGQIAVTSLLDPCADSAEFATKMVANGDVPADFVPVLFDIDKFPECNSQYWRFDKKLGLVGDLEAALAAAKAEAWSRVKLERDTRMQRGGFKVGTHWFYSDELSRNKYAAMAFLGDNLPSGIEWKTMSGEFVTMTPDIIRQIVTTQVISDNAVFVAAEAHRAALENSTDPESHDCTTGWPEMFNN